ncbi:MAG: hypothetical protein GY866_34700 [Proteobacteria bacterium]|nr:hypothetical protein [Pseudomonadota bacterium]
MTEKKRARSKEPIHSGYMKWVTSRKDWRNVINEVCKAANAYDFVFSIMSNTVNGESEELFVKINENFGTKGSDKIAEFMSSFTLKNFGSIVTHIKNNHNELSLYRIRDQKIAARMHVPVNSNIFEIRSDKYKTARIMIVFQKPRIPAEMELMLQRIKKKVLQKKSSLFF